MSTAQHQQTSPPPHGAAHAPWQSGVLQAIFALFLGIIIALVVGVGVNTFHPNPADETRQQLEQLYAHQDAVPDKADPSRIDNPTQRQIAALEATAQQQEEDWSGSTSVVLIVIATVLLVGAVVLARVASAWVFSTGLLLGGIFTMLYGIGWSMASGESVTRFLVLVAALAVAGILGYVRFVRVPKSVPAGTLDTTSVAELAPDIDRRLTALESSMGALRDALRR